jgi:hypothetical protein
VSHFGTPTVWREVPVKLHMNEHFLFLKVKLNLRRDVRRHTDDVETNCYAMLCYDEDRYGRR